MLCAVCPAPVSSSSVQSSGFKWLWEASAWSLLLRLDVHNFSGLIPPFNVYLWVSATKIMCVSQCHQVLGSRTSIGTLKVVPSRCMFASINWTCVFIGLCVLIVGFGCVLACAC